MDPIDQSSSQEAAKSKSNKKDIGEKPASDSSSTRSQRRRKKQRAQAKLKSESLVSEPSGNSVSSANSAGPKPNRNALVASLLKNLKEDPTGSPIQVQPSDSAYVEEASQNEGHGARAKHSRGNAMEYLQQGHSSDRHPNVSGRYVRQNSEPSYSKGQQREYARQSSGSPYREDRRYLNQNLGQSNDNLGRHGPYTRQSSGSPYREDGHFYDQSAHLARQSSPSSCNEYRNEFYQQNSSYNENRSHEFRRQNSSSPYGDRYYPRAEELSRPRDEGRPMSYREMAEKQRAYGERLAGRNPTRNHSPMDNHAHQNQSERRGRQGNETTPKSGGKLNKKDKKTNKQCQDAPNPGKNFKAFEDYWPMEKVSDGLKRGSLIEAAVRINPKNFEAAYVPHPDGVSDIYIDGVHSRNRALNGDIVAILLHGREDWRVCKENLEKYESSACAEECAKKSDPKETKSESDSEPDVIVETEESIDHDVSGASSGLKKDAHQNLQENLAAINLNKHDGSADKKDVKQSKKKKEKTKHALKIQDDKFTSVKEVLNTGSPMAKKLFGGENEAEKLIQRTGKVVAIVEKKHSRACTGHIRPLQDNRPDQVLFAPIDHRVPRMLVPMTDCPKDFRERPDIHANSLFISRITEWKNNSQYAVGNLMRSLGEAGQIEPETEGLLVEYAIDFTEFPDEALECLPLTPWEIPEVELSTRRDFRRDCIFTIDPATARDLDDALSCEEVDEGIYRIGVHIADVSYFLQEDTKLDLVAAKRATSVYLTQKVIPMLPRLLCEQLCSLNPYEDRLAFSVVWKITEKGEILEEWFGRSVIRSCVKLSYDHAQGFIEDPSKEWETEELPEISNGFHIPDIKSRVLNLHKIAVNLRKQRAMNGALRLDQVKLQFTLDSQTGLPNGYSVYQQRESNRLVEEYMLLANMAIAHKIYGSYPQQALLRRHPRPSTRMVDELTSLSASLGVPLDLTSSQDLQTSLQSYAGTDDFSRARMQVLVSLCSRPMQLARYFCTGVIDDEELFRHYALNVPLYTHFTSPIRRYADVMVHRSLASSLGYCTAPEKTAKMIEKQATHCNDKKSNAKTVSDLSSDLYFSVFVKEVGPLEESAMVMGVMDRSFDVFILKLGVTKRVYCEKLPLKSHDFIKEQSVPVLKLTWKADEDHPRETQQRITIFTLVKCILQADKLPLKWSAFIKHPDDI